MAAARAIAKVAGLTGALSLVVSGCSTHPAGPDTTTTTRPHQSTTSTTLLPRDLQASPEAAATAFVAAWARGNQLAGLALGTPNAVATLFAVPYPQGLAISRGCSTAFPPIVCTFGPPGGAPPTDPIYEIYVSQASGGWYVSSAKIN
jgi:hypothetical protein